MADSPSAATVTAYADSADSMRSVIIGSSSTRSTRAARHLLVTGQNTLAIQVHNDSLGSSDLSLIPALDIER